MFQNQKTFILQCENCDHAPLCRILNPYQSDNCFILATSTNFSIEELEQTEYYLSLMPSSVDG